jgi:hypothetical protein
MARGWMVSKAVVTVAFSNSALGAPGFALPAAPRSAEATNPLKSGPRSTELLVTEKRDLRCFHAPPHYRQSRHGKKRP